MPRNKTLIIMLAAVLVLGGIYAAVTLMTGPEEEPDLSASGGQFVLSDIDQTTVMGLSYTMGGQDFNFKYSAYGWQLADNTEMPLDQDVMEEMVSSLCNVTSDRKLETGRESFSEYGLDPAFVRVTLTDSKGESYTYNIGDKHEVSAKFYFNVEGTDEIYTVPTLVGRSFQNHPTVESLLKLPRFPSVSPSNTSAFTVEYNGNAYEVVYMADGYEGCYSSDYRWFLKSGGDMLPLDDEEMTNLLNVYSSLGMMTGVAWSSAPEVLAQYGLESGYITVTVSYTDGNMENVTKSFYLGKGQDGKCYGRVDGSDVIGQMANAYDFFLFSYDKYAPLDLFKMSPSTIDTMTAVVGENRYAIKGEHEISVGDDGKETSADSYTFNGKALDGQAMDKLFNTMRGVKAEGVAPVGRSEAQPYIEMTFERNTATNRQMTLRLWEYDSSFYLSEFDGRFLLINKLDAEAIANALNEAVATAQ